MSALPTQPPLHRDPQISRLALDMLDEMLLLVSIDAATHRITSLNDITATCAGRSVESLLGEPVEALLKFEPEAFAALLVGVRGGDAAVQTLPLVGGEGAMRLLSARFALVGGGTGESDAVLMMARDCTDEEQVRHELQGKFTAIDRAQAVIEFDLQGKVLHANDNFLTLTGYTLDEVKGQHHRMFCEASLTASDDYAAFWQRLGGGEFESGEFKRLCKGGRAVWIRATYNPIFDLDGKPIKVVKYALDVTANKLANVEQAGKVRAIDRAQAAIEFNLDGEVLTANDNFLHLMGYALCEVKGQHHRMFCEDSLAGSAEYELFWSRLRAGQFESGEFKRIGRGGKEVWIRATYNPILDIDGKPVKIIKYALDVTATKARTAEFEGKVQAISRAQAVIEFDLNGTVLDANRNFLDLMGYTAEEVKGQHHRLFVHEDEARSGAYRAFWQKLSRGEFDAGEYKRLGKGGKEVWIRATYNPIFDLNGNPVKVVKYAMDMTESKLRNADFEGKVRAVDRARACVEYDLDGRVLAANENFLKLLGYTLEEVKGKHHRNFVEPGFAASDTYRDFWHKLGRGELDSGEYKRIGKDGREG